MEFHISREIRDQLELDDVLFSYTGNVVFANVAAARTAHYHPAVALLTAYPVEDDAWQEMGADRMLVKPMQTPVLIRQLEKLLESHAAKLAKISEAAAPASDGRSAAKKGTAKKSAAKRPASKKLPAKKTAKKAGGRKAVKKRAR